MFHLKRKRGHTNMSMKRKPPLYQLVCKLDGLVYYYSTNKQEVIDLMQIAWQKFDKKLPGDFYIRKLNSIKKQKKVYVDYDSEDTN